MLPPAAMFTTRSITRIVALMGALVLLAVGCARPAPAQLPRGDDLLRAAAQEMQTIANVRFDLDVTGPLGTLGIQRAHGVLTREGDVSGTVTLNQTGTPVEYEVVISGDTMYLKGATSRFQALPAGSVYNPAELLRPSGGLAKVLTATSGARTETAEAVDGRSAHRVAAMIDAAALEGLLPIQLQEDQVPALLWIGQDQAWLLRARLTATTQGENEPTTMTVTLSDFNATVEITPPPT
jgi:hypothetical protein